MVRHRSLLSQVPVSLRPNYLKLQMAGHAPQKQIDRVLREASPSPTLIASTSQHSAEEHQLFRLLKNVQMQGTRDSEE